MGCSHTDLLVSLMADRIPPVDLESGKLHWIPMSYVHADIQGLKCRYLLRPLRSVNSVDEVYVAGTAAQQEAPSGAIIENYNLHKRKITSNAI